MRTHPVLRILLIVFIWHLALPGQAGDEDQPHPVLSGAYVEFPPLTYTDESGDPAGPYIRKASRIARAAGYRVKWQSLPIDRIYLYLREGKLDLWIGSKGVPVIADATLEPGFTFRPIRLNAYHLEGQEPVDGLLDLRGRHLILIRGYTYRNYLEPVIGSAETRVDTASDHGAALRMLRAGRGDYVLDFEAPVRNTLKKTPIDNLRKSPITTWPTTLVFSAQTARAQTLVEDFDKAYTSIQSGLRR